MTHLKYINTSYKDAVHLKQLMYEAIENYMQHDSSKCSDGCDICIRMHVLVHEATWQNQKTLTNKEI